MPGIAGDGIDPIEYRKEQQQKKKLAAANTFLADGVSRDTTAAYPSALDQVALTS